MVRTIAITGGIGSGKSHVRAALEAYGFVCFNADAFAREILFNSKVTSQIRSHFGEDVFRADGELDREKMRELVFADTSRRKVLEGITHPAIAELFFEKKQLLSELSSTAWMFYEAPVILEAGRQQDFDVVVLVTAREDVRLDRLWKGRGMETQTAQKIMSSQMPESEKKKLSHFVIDNSGELSDLNQKVNSLIEFLRHRFA